MLGKGRSYLINSRLVFFISNDTQSIFNLFLKQVFNTKVKKACEVTLSGNDNLPFYVILSGVVSGNGRECLVTMTNVSGLKKAEENLLESEELYRQVLENSMDAILLTAPDGSIFSANPAACDMLQRTENEICALGRNGLLDRDAPRLYQLMEERQKTGKAKGELFMLKKDGTKFPVEVSTSVFTDKSGRLRTSMVIRDITERMNSEVTLRASEKRFRELFGNMFEGYAYCQMIFENGQATDWIYLDVNDKFEKLTGLKNVRGRRESEVVPDVRELDAHLFEIYTRVALGGQPENFEIFRVSLQEWFSISVYCPAKGCFITLFNIISQRKRVEEKLKNAYKVLVQLYKHQEVIKENERKAISREIHDELGQLLTALKIDLGWTSDHIENKKEIKKKLSGMDDLVSETIGIVQRISSDLRPAMLDDLGLSPALQWYCQNFEKRTSIKCYFKLDEVNSKDEDKNIALYRILQEALTNVLRHAKATSVYVYLHCEQGFIILEIRDNGIGMDQEKINSNNSLGFMGIRERVNQFNGSMDITSARNKGTKLSVIIPFS